MKKYSTYLWWASYYYLLIAMYGAFSIREVDAPTSQFILLALMGLTVPRGRE